MDSVETLFRFTSDFERNNFNHLSDFEQAVYKVEEDHPEYNLKCYQEVLESNGLEWSQDSLVNADISGKDTQCLLAMILSIIRADRFNEGVLMEFLKRGYITSWLIELERKYNG